MATKTPTKRKMPGAGRAKKAAATSKAAPRSRGKLSKSTVDPAEIQKWAAARDARPAKVKGTGKRKDDIGIIRLDLPGFSGVESLEEISWEEFFEAFEQNNLAFVYQEKTAAGKPSNFNKFVSRDSLR